MSAKDDKEIASFTNNAADNQTSNATVESVLMSSDILPLVLKFLPRNEMRKVAMVCHFFKTVVALHLDPVLLTFIVRNGPFEREYLPLLFSPKTQAWRQAATRHFPNTLEWTKLNGFYYVIRYDTTCRYDPIDDTWIELPSQACPTRQEFGFTSLGDKLCLMGGKNVNFGNVELFDPKLGQRWMGPPNLVEHVASSACTLDGFIYVVGGFDLAQVERWRPDRPTWKAVASMSRARWTHITCSVNKRMYVFGGLSGEMTIHTRPFVPETSCEMFDPLTHQWTPIAPMPTLRTGFSHLVVGHCVYIVGGYIHSGGAEESYFRAKATNLVEIYDTETNTWSVGEPIPETATKSNASSHTLETLALQSMPSFLDLS